MSGTCDACGWIAALCSMLSFGSFAVPIKSQRAKSVDVDPLVFQSYKTIMCFLTCWLVLLAGVPFEFTPWGIVSGLFWVPGGVATVYAVKVAGVAIGTGMGSSVIVLVSFIWGIFIFNEHVHSRAGASFAILCMMGGLMGMAYFSSPESEPRTTTASGGNNNRITVTTSGGNSNTSSPSAAYQQVVSDDADEEGDDEEVEHALEDATGVSIGALQHGKATATSNSTERTLNTLDSDVSGATDSFEDEDDNTNGAVELADGLNHNGSSPETESLPGPVSYHDHHTTEMVELCGLRISRRNSGILAAALFTGVWGGSILVPMQWCDSEASGINFLISFAVGASIVTIGLWVIRLFYNAYHCGSVLQAYEELPSFHVAVMWLPGGISGILWSLGNFFSIFSVYYLGEGVGYPLVQTSILVSGLWGIFYFREVTGTRRISLWLCSSSLCIFGILLLSYEHVGR